MTKRIAFLLVVGWLGILPARARLFETEQQYAAQYGANINKGLPAPAPYKFALYMKKQLRVLVLFENQTSVGELISKPTSRLTEADVTAVLAANQGGSAWKKEKVETTKDPNAPQMSMWTRSDGKLFAAYITTGVPFPLFLIGTRGGGEFLIKQKDHLTSYVK